MNNIYLKQAIRGIKSSPSRTILTMLGIMIGIATVIVVLSAGEGFKSYINSQIEANGSNTIFVEVSVPASTKQRSDSDNKTPRSQAFSAVQITTLKSRDLEDIENLPNVRGVYGVAVGQKTTTYKNVSKNASVVGSDAARFLIDKGELEKGRAFTYDEDKTLSQVAVLGHSIYIDLFGEEDPLGKLIRVGNSNFLVIGVYKEKGGFDGQDDQIFIPLRTLQKKILGTDYLFYGIVQLEDNNKADSTSLDMADILRRNHFITDPARDDFKVATQAENLEIFGTILNAVSFLLIAIATISLIVGGVGVMNIMYVAVTERIGEIGLKKALGATKKDILYEFIIEAVVLTVLGGILGILGGVFFSFIVSKIAHSFGLSWDFVLPLWGMVIAIVVSMAIGMIFGVFPAKNAAKLDPIEALNKE